MTHQTVGLTVALFTSAIGMAVAVGAGLLAIRRASKSGDSSLAPPQGPTAAFVSAALLAAMMGALIYQGVDNRFPPDFIGAAVFLAGTLIALWMGLRRLQGRGGTRDSGLPLSRRLGSFQKAP